VTFDKRTVALGVAAAVAIAAAVVVTTIGHHSTGSRQRKAVAAYINEVNALQNHMHAPLARVMLAYSSFGRGRTAGPSPGALAAAAVTLTRLDRRLTRLACPPEARPLRQRLTALVDREVSITREVQRLSAFSPQYLAALRRLHTASLKLDSTLKTISVPAPHVLRGTKQAVARATREFQAKAQRAAAAQADAVDAYDDAVTGVLDRVLRLRPPPALRPAYRAQVAALREVTTSGAALAAQLRSAKRAQINALSRRFSLASRSAGTIAVQRAQIAAIRAYNKRARQVGTAAGAVQAEIARLERDLP
jgi:hypothetical protein